MSEATLGTKLLTKELTKKTRSTAPSGGREPGASATSRSIHRIAISVRSTRTRPVRMRAIASRTVLPPNGFRQRLEMPGRVLLDLVGAPEELRVGHELLHRADVHLARAEAGRAG